MRKPILYVDMDGVICDFENEVLKHCPDLRSGKYTDTKAEVDRICQQNFMFFLDMQPIPGAIDAIRSLSNHFLVYFLSTPMWELPQSYMHKRMWIERHFGKDFEKRLILTHAKDLQIGDYLVDDRASNGASEFMGEWIKFGTSGKETWKEVYDLLMRRISNVDRSIDQHRVAVTDTTTGKNVNIFPFRSEVSAVEGFDAATKHYDDKTGRYQWDLQVMVQDLWFTRRSKFSMQL